MEDVTDLSLDERMVEKMRMLRAVRVTMGPSSVVTSGWKLYSTVVYLRTGEGFEPCMLNLTVIHNTYNPE